MSDERPNAYIQWKGTSVCLDLRCACGADSHLDDDFAYFVKCCRCGRVWEMPTTVALTEGHEHDEPAARETFDPDQRRGRTDTP